MASSHPRASGYSFLDQAKPRTDPCSFGTAGHSRQVTWCRSRCHGTARCHGASEPQGFLGSRVCGPWSFQKKTQPRGPAQAVCFFHDVFFLPYLSLKDLEWKEESLARMPALATTDPALHKSFIRFCCPYSRFRVAGTPPTLKIVPSTPRTSSLTHIYPTVVVRSNRD